MPEHSNHRRSRSPERKRHSHRERSPHRHHHKRRRTTPPAEPILLPYNARQLGKRDLPVFMPMFGLYLDIQKSIVLEDLSGDEVKGRWKSFVGKWNRRELAEGWYDPNTLQKAIASAAEEEEYGRHREPEARGGQKRSEKETEKKPQRADKERGQDQEDTDDSDDSVGPALPGHEQRRRRAGPSIPNTEDLALKREMEAEDGVAARDDLRHERKLERKAQKEALDDLVPRAEAGTRERRLEKKAAVNETMRAFREKSPGGEVPDGELMGGGDGVADFKRQKEQVERKKNERELRKEEFLRARQAERDERLLAYRDKEEGTMAMLKALAKQNFGA